MDAAAQGRYLAILHAPSYIRAEELAEMARRYNATAPITPRPRQQVTRFFDGLGKDWSRAGEPDAVARMG